MSVAASDLVAYLSVNVPVDLVSTVGGAIDSTLRPDFTQIGANDTVYVKSTSASDSGNITVVGRNAAGSLVSETKAINGTTGANLTVLATVERVLSAVMAAGAVGTVTVGRGTFGSPGTTIRTIPPGEKGFKAIFQQQASATGSSTDFYQKFFWKNAHATLALLAAAITEGADPDARLTHALETSVNGSTTAANQITAPGSVTAFGGTSITLATATGTADLVATAAIGVWLKLTLPANDPSHRSTYTSTISGSSV